MRGRCDNVKIISPSIVARNNKIRNVELLFFISDQANSNKALTRGPLKF